MVKLPVKLLVAACGLSARRRDQENDVRSQCRHSWQHRRILDAGHDLYGEELCACGPIVSVLINQAIKRLVTKVVGSVRIF